LAWPGLAWRGLAGRGEARQGFLLTKTKGKVMQFEIQIKEIEKGTIIPIKEVERLTGTQYGTTDYAFKIMSLGQFVEQQMRERGEEVSTAIRKGNLHVLDDPQAEMYQTARFAAGLQCMTRASGKHALIDYAKLDEQQKETYQHNRLMQSRILQAVKREKKLLPAENRELK
jgi:hypothetical protein